MFDRFQNSQRGGRRFDPGQLHHVFSAIRRSPSAGTFSELSPRSEPLYLPFVFGDSNVERVQSGRAYLVQFAFIRVGANLTGIAGRFVVTKQSILSDENDGHAISQVWKTDMVGIESYFVFIQEL